MAQKIKKTTTNKIQIIGGGKICTSLQCNISYRVIDANRLDLEDTAGQKTSLFANQVTQTELAPAAAVSASFANAQELADFLDANFFAG